MNKFRQVASDEREGGGKKFTQFPDISSLLEDLINRHKAGSPTDSSVYWTHLKPKEFARIFMDEQGIQISHGLIKRKYRDGKCFMQGQIEVYDHDYEHLATGKVIPHGIYDLQRNEGFITIGNSHETAAFVAENLLWWWENFGLHHYPDAQVILVLCDAGGANSYRHYAFKEQMLCLAQTIGKDILICHYPPYASKWNPIEHRLFAHVHHAIQGVVFSDYKMVKELGSCSRLAEHQSLNELRRHFFQIMHPLKHGDIKMNVMFANPLKSTQKVAQLSPKSFDGVGVNFVYAVSVVISGPLLGAMAYRSMIQYLCANMIVGIAFVTVTGSCRV
jgi:hypothetical protein